MNKQESGFTYVEVIIAMVLLSVCLAPLLIMFPTGSKEGQLATLYTRATNLAEDMMEEIKGKAFEDPSSPDGESFRKDFDDVDDYDDWGPKSPPEDIDGNAMDGTAGMPDFSGFGRQVEVDYAELSGNQWGLATSPPTDYKMVTVTVSHDNMRDVELVTIVANY